MKNVKWFASTKFFVACSQDITKTKKKNCSYNRLKCRKLKKKDLISKLKTQTTDNKSQNNFLSIKTERLIER